MTIMLRVGTHSFDTLDEKLREGWRIVGDPKLYRVSKEPGSYAEAYDLSWLYILEKEDNEHGLEYGDKQGYIAGVEESRIKRAHDAYYERTTRGSVR